MRLETSPIHIDIIFLKLPQVIERRRCLLYHYVYLFPLDMQIFLSVFEIRHEIALSRT